MNERIHINASDKVPFLALVQLSSHFFFPLSKAPGSCFPSYCSHLVCLRCLSSLAYYRIHSEKYYPPSLSLPEAKVLNQSFEAQSLVFFCFYFYYHYFLKFIYLLIYFWLHWVFVAARRLSLVATSSGYSSLQCAGFSLRWLLLLRSTGSRRAGFSSCGTRASVVVARGLQSTGSVLVVHGLSCSTACEIFPDQGLNPCLLHWQADS